jgi:hypothetical protein
MSKTPSPSLLLSLLGAFFLASGCGGESFTEGEAGEGGSESGSGGSASGRAGSAGKGNAGTAQGGSAGNFSKSVGGAGPAGAGGVVTGGVAGAGAFGGAGDAGEGGVAGAGAFAGAGAGGTSFGGAGPGGTGSSHGGVNAGFGGSFAGNGGSGGGTCDDPDSSQTDARFGARTQSTVTGSNGAFSDECDDQGNLVEYACEMTCGPLEATPGAGDAAAPIAGAGGAGGAVPCQLAPSGRVVPSTLDCQGSCQNGACFTLCPDTGDQFSVTTIDTGRVALKRGDDEPLDCTVVTASGGYACADIEWLGDTLTVTSVAICEAEQVVFSVSHPDIELSSVCTYGCVRPIAQSR